MRILRVITRLDVQGGAELSTLIEVEALAARGHQVLVVTLSERATVAASSRLLQVGAETTHLDGSIPAQALALRRLLRTWAPDVVDAVIWESEVVTGLACVRSGVPTIVSLVNMQYAPEAVAGAPSPRRLELVRRIEGLLLRHMIDHYRCLTAALADHSARYLGLSRGRMSVIPRGRDAGTWDVDESTVRVTRAELVDGADVLLVNVGRHEMQKGQDLLVEAMSAIAPTRRIRLVVAGRDGNRTESLRSQIRDLGLDRSVDLLGVRQDVPALLRAADVVVVSSRYEGVAGAAVEGLGAGAAIVGFAIPSVREVVEDAGVLVEPFDVDALAEAIVSLADDRERRRTLSTLARARFEGEFELNSVITRLEGMYSSLVAAKGPSRVTSP